MGRLRSRGLQGMVAILALWTITGCGGTKAGNPIFPGKVILTPAQNTSIVIGGILGFTASAQTSTGTNIATPITFTSSDTSILTLAPNGVACAGQWNANFTVCTPGGTGYVTVTASALGKTSVPTNVFVHQPIDNITVTGVLLNGVQVQEPCLSQGQSMTVQASAFSQGVDITSTVGTFTFTANNPAVVTFTPIVNTNYNFATNQYKVTANNPGITQIFASAGGVTSSSFQQPPFQSTQGESAPVLDFFSTCPIERIALDLGDVGSDQTSFVTAKGGTGSETILATITDVMGNTSLPNTNGLPVLSKIPLTWTSTQPGSITVGAACLESCTLNTPLPGSAAVTASCSPPTCNIGFPVVPTSLSTQAQIDACTQFFHAQYSQFASCQQLIPEPVYADIAVSGIVTGPPSPASLLSTSLDCASIPPDVCSASIYSFSTSKASTGNETPLPFSPNSLLFDLAGDKAYMGSDFGAQLINPANFATANNPYTALGTVTGKALAVSTNGQLAIFADNVHSPNQVYVVNTSNATSPTATAFNISQAGSAAFSPDGLKAFILGGTNQGSMYVFSSLQALQGPFALQGPGNSIAFSPNGAFAFVAESSSGANPPNLTAYATCSNNSAASVSLPANPLLMKVSPVAHISGTDSLGNPIPDGIHIFVLDATGFDVITATITPPASGTLCPQGLAFNPAQRIELNQGTLQPINFFFAADGSLLYVAATSNARILVYDFGTGAVTGIELTGSATPITADMSVDAGTILVAGSDNMLHEVSTQFGGGDSIPLSFPNLPDYLNPFCTYTPTSNPCRLDLVVAKP